VIASGRNDWDERGVETPVCGPVDVPYMVGVMSGHRFVVLFVAWISKWKCARRQHGKKLLQRGGKPT